MRKSITIYTQTNSNTDVKQFNDFCDWYNRLISIILAKLNTRTGRGYCNLARLLSLELFILGVQAKKLHFCNLELILNKTGYSHIMENKKKNFFIF